MKIQGKVERFQHFQLLFHPLIAKKLKAASLKAFAVHLGLTSRILLENLFVHIGSYFQNLCGALKKEKNNLKIICNCQSYGLVKMFLFIGVCLYISY